MAIKDLANVVISTTGPALTQVGFGTVLCAAYCANAIFGAQEYTRIYTDLATAVADGFTQSNAATRPVYDMLSRAFAQQPSPPQVKVGKLTLAPTQTVKFKVNGSPANTTLYGFTMTRGIVSVDIAYTSDGSATALEILTGLAAAVEASALGAAVAATVADTNTSCQIVEGTPGTLTYYSNWTTNLLYLDTTADPGIATDLATLSAHDADWYFLTIDHNCLAISTAAAGYVETLDTGMFFTNVSDSDGFNSGVSTDLGKALMTLAIARTCVLYDLDSTDGYSGVAAAAERAPHDPGQPGAGGTFHGKTQRGVSADPLNPTQKANLRAKHYMVYITTASRNHTLDGKVADGEFADIVRGRDWFKIRTEESIATAILNADKISYTDRGISVIKSCLDAMGALAESVELFVPGSFSSSAIPRASTQQADRDARKYTGLKFTGIFAGAIHLVDPVSGSLST